MSNKQTTGDKINITDAIARVKSFSMQLPNTKAHRISLMREIAKYFQKKQGHFYFDQIIDVLELAYGFGEALEETLLQELEEWLSNEPAVKFLGEEGGFYAYQME